MDARRRSGTLRPLAAAFLVVTAAAGPQEETSEYLLKARALARTLYFIQWPDGSVPEAPGEPVVLAVLGRTPLRWELGPAFKGTLVRGHPVKVVYAATLEELPPCRILFIADSEQHNLDRILNSLQNRPILTLGDTPGYASRGVMINLTVEQEHIRIEVNLGRAQQAKFHLAASFLQFTRVVG